MMRARAMVHYAPSPRAGRCAVQSAGRTHRRRRLGVLRPDPRAVARRRPRRARSTPPNRCSQNTRIRCCTWRPKAELLTGAGRYDDAIEAADRATRASIPKTSRCRSIYADALSGAKRYREAEAVLLRQSVRNARRHRRLVRTRRNRRARRRHRAGAPRARRVFRARGQPAEEHSASRIRARTGAAATTTA